MEILIIDDKQENLYLLDSLLKGYGYEVISAVNGSEALEILNTKTPALIISDILMPIMDGYTFCRECKKDERLKNIPFIFYTATYTNPEDEEFSLNLGADRFVLKPQEPDVFINIVEEVLNSNKNKKDALVKNSNQPEDVVLKEYNSILIRKLEDKMRQSEENEKQLKKYVVELEENIKERKKAEEEVLKSQENLRALTARLEQVKEEERIHLSRELHDHLGQNLTGLKMDIAFIAKKIQAGVTIEQKDFLSRTSDMLSLIDELINNVRKIAAELRPNVLDYLGLIPAIEWQVEELKKRTEINCVFKSAISKIDFGSHINTTIFRIVQEAFTNIIRHSQASKVELIIEDKENEIKLSITDNGIGINEEKLSNIKSLGIIGMKERTLQFNGKLSLQNAPEGGTLITLFIPKKVNHD